MTQTPHSTSDPDQESNLTSKLLAAAGFRHAFLTRRGGVSGGPFSSLSFVQNTGDSAEHVRENLKRVARILDVSDRHIYYLSQVHGTAVHIARSDEVQADVLKLQGDIVISSDPHAAAAVRTADCVPVLLACRKTGWVGACHSGWQGCVRGAAPASVEALRRQGASDLIAAIGPHISQAAFEVGDDVAKQLLDASPDKTIVDRSRSKPHVNLRAMVRAQLIEAGLQAENIDDVAGCTMLEPDKFFSFRRDGNPSGRMLNLVVARPPLLRPDSAPDEIAVLGSGPLMNARQARGE